ncbi:MAG: DUF998 domain-containing protein [Bacteroidota bacterium]|nr:DUF998 domain-containing protein [Bacteroidota bacterium]
MPTTTLTFSDTIIPAVVAERQPKLQRITLLIVLAYEAAGCLVGGSFLIAAPDGRLMDMPVELMHGAFLDFLIPGIILFGFGVLNTAAFIAVLRRSQSDWVASSLALGGLLIWFLVEIIILHELHWLHAMWGLPVVLGLLVTIPLYPTWRVTSQKAALYCGVLAALIYVGTDILAGNLYKGFSFTSQAVSELFAIGAPTSRFVVPLFTLSSVFLLVFALGIWQSSKQNRPLRLLAWMLIGNAINSLVLWNFFPMHMRGAERTFTDTMHLILAINPFVLLSIGFGVAAFRNWFRFYSIATIVLLVVPAIYSFLYLPQGVDAHQPTPWLGLTERVAQYGYQMWLVVLAITTLRVRERT